MINLLIKIFAFQSGSSDSAFLSAAIMVGDYLAGAVHPYVPLHLFRTC